MFAGLTSLARRLRRDSHAVYLASRDPRVPLPVKLLAVAVAAYALSPIDLIPDFIPLIGYLDDLIIVPLGILLVIKLIPDDVMAEYRIKASLAQRPISRLGLTFVILLWMIGLLGAGWLGYRYWYQPPDPVAP